MRARGRFSLWLPLVAALAWSPSVSAVTIDWVPIGNPGNACETQSQGCFGDVAYGYQISKYEVTNAQYAEFLNAVADTDTNALYNPSMGSNFAGGITRSGVSGGFSYSAIAGRGDMPVNYVSWYDSLRFANWLDNGQPTGAQGIGTTETGAYTFSGPTTVGARNADATIFLTSEDEWYKAAYHNALGLAATDYYDHPAGTNTQTVCASPTAAPNHANCDGIHMPQNVTNKGSYTGSASPYGTFDQGGNVFEWNEAIISGSFRGLRGGSFINSVIYLAASTRFVGYEPPAEDNIIGFRVASIPEPGTGLLVMTGLLGLACRRRRRT